MADARTNRAASLSRPVPGRRPLDDDMLAMLVALTTELTVVRARQDAMERLLQSAGVLLPNAVNGFEADPEAARARSADRARIIANVFRPVRARAEAEGDPA